MVGKNKKEVAADGGKNKKEKGKMKDPYVCVYHTELYQVLLENNMTFFTPNTI